MKKIFFDLKNKILSFARKNRRLFIVTLVLIFVLLFATVYSFLSSSKVKADSEIVTTKTVVDDRYETMVENKILQMLLSLSEVSKANVMVVCETSVVNEYLKNTSETTSTSDANSTKTITEDIVFEKNGSNNSPIIVSSTFPKVMGVWVIVNNISASTKLAIISSICSVLNISESCISILQER